jgi:hypothetical protein
MVAGVIRYDLIVKNHGRTPAELGSVLMDGGTSLEKLTAQRGRSFGTWLGSGEKRTIEESLDLHQLVLGSAPEAEFGVFKVRIYYFDLVCDRDNAQKTEFVYYYRPLLNSIERISTHNKYK